MSGPNLLLCCILHKGLRHFHARKEAAIREKDVAKEDIRKGELPL